MHQEKPCKDAKTKGFEVMRTLCSS